MTITDYEATVYAKEVVQHELENIGYQAVVDYVESYYLDSVVLTEDDYETIYDEVCHLADDTVQRIEDLDS